MSGFITGGITLACSDQDVRGGVKDLYLINRDKITSFTAGSEHDYTAVAVDSSSDLEARWHQFEFDDYTCFANSEGTAEDNNTNTQAMTIECFMSNQEKTKGDKLTKLIDSCKTVAIVKLTTGKAFVMGWDEKIEKLAALRAKANSESGTAMADRSGYLLTLAGQGADLPRQFIGDIVITDGTTVSFT